jgi:glutathione S-transferase
LNFSVYFSWGKNMIVVHTFGPAFGQPDASPFVTKVMLLLKFSALPYRTTRGNLFRAPKKKLPVIEDDGRIIADSTFIRFHLERKYGVDFDAGLTAEQKAVAWAVEKMCEEHLYFALVHVRWCEDEGFRRTAQLFDAISAPLRPLIAAVARRKVRNIINAQGFGRHSPEEIAHLAERDIDTLATLLGSKPFLMGERPSAADAAVFPMLAGLRAPAFPSRIRASIERHDNLTGYVTRISESYFKQGSPAAAGASAA